MLLHTGAEVFREITGPDGKPRAQADRVGIEVNCQVTAFDDGTFKLVLSFQERFVLADGEFGGFSGVVKNISLRDGGSTQYKGVDETGGKEPFTIDVTLTVQK